MWRSAESFLRHVLEKRPRGWHPLLAVYYLTYGCSFRCPYCSDGAGRPYHTLRDSALPAPEVLELLRRIRARCDHLVLTGGEPTSYAELPALLDALPSLGFDTAVLTTNGYRVDALLPALGKALTHLVFSLDTLDQERADRTYGVGSGALAQILVNIERADATRQQSGRRCEIVISAVATPDNLDELPAVYDFAREHGYRYALCPQLVGVHPHQALRDNPRYQRLFDQLIADKKRGVAIQGSPLYLQYMRDLATFSCRPSTMLAVAPNGDVFYPCLELGQVAGNLLETADLDALRQLGQARFGPEPSCGNRCHSACALAFGLLYSHPWSVAEEALLLGKTALLGAFGR